MQSTLSSQSEMIATLTTRLSTCESNYERQGHELQQMKDRQQELITSVKELARRAATPSTALPGLKLCNIGGVKLILYEVWAVWSVLFCGSREHFASNFFFSVCCVITASRKNNL